MHAVTARDVLAKLCVNCQDVTLGENAIIYTCGDPWIYNEYVRNEKFMWSGYRFENMKSYKGEFNQEYSLLSYVSHEPKFSRP